MRLSCPEESRSVVGRTGKLLAVSVLKMQGKEARAIFGRADRGCGTNSPACSGSPGEASQGAKQLGVLLETEASEVKRGCAPEEAGLQAGTQVAGTTPSRKARREGKPDPNFFFLFHFFFFFFFWPRPRSI